MYSTLSDLPNSVRSLLAEGTVIPAHPLVLDADKQLDERRQRAVTRYYLDAGAGGLAVGVHTTQFAIRTHGLYEPVLALASEEARTWTNRPLVLVAGVAGKIEQALAETEVAQRHGYHFAMVNVSAYATDSEDVILEHCKRIAEVMPIIGFYLLPECGGRFLSCNFWRELCLLDNIAAIKMAPFNRYQTLDVVKGLVAAQAENRVTLYTGNDDHIVLDLVAPFIASRDGQRVEVRIQGGLLGHWSVWVKPAVELFERIRRERSCPTPELLALDSIVTDCNAAVYDARHKLRGCIPGCLEVLRRQGLVEHGHCLNPNEVLSPGQSEEINRIYEQFPEFTDDAFVAKNLERWLT